MKMYWFKGGFYTSSVHETIPANAIDVSDIYKALLRGQSEGWRIMAPDSKHALPWLDEQEVPSEEELSNQMRKRRDGLLSSCDWTQMPDCPMEKSLKAVWQDYRQALRDVPLQGGFPRDVVWPVSPVSEDVGFS